MQRAAAEQLARQLMAQHEVTDWQFKWSNGKRTLAFVGAKRVRQTGELRDKTFSLSRHLVDLNDEEAVRDTILHEIAHIKAGLHNGHNYIWRMWCLRIGAKPNRCAQDKEAAPHTHEVYCSCCGEVARKLYAKSRKDFSRHYCRHCGVNKSLGKIACREVTR